MRNANCEEPESFELETKMMNIQIANLECFFDQKRIGKHELKGFCFADGYI